MYLVYAIIDRGSSGKHGCRGGDAADGTGDAGVGKSSFADRTKIL
jgi:hypothetical protein